MRVTVVDGSSRVSFITADDDTHTLVLTLNSALGVVLSQQLFPTAPTALSANTASTPTHASPPRGDMTPLEALADNAYGRSATPSRAPEDTLKGVPMACGVDGCVCDLFESAVPALPSVCSCGHGAMYHTRSRLRTHNGLPHTPGPAMSSMPSQETGTYGGPPSDARPPNWADASCEDISRMGGREEALGDWHAAADPKLSKGYYQKSFRTQMKAMHSLCRTVNEKAAGATTAAHGAESFTDTHVVFLKGLLQRCASLAEKSSYA